MSSVAVMRVLPECHVHSGGNFFDGSEIPGRQILNAGFPIGLALANIQHLENGGCVESQALRQ